MDRLSELEGAVLGLLWSDGPMTAYAVRQHFLRSRSSHFSGSAGAIYPLVGRLDRGGLVETEASAQGKRSMTLYWISARGRKALRGWLLPVEDWMAAVEFDPIRTRVHFLGAIPAARRARFLREAARRLDAEIEATESLIGQLEDRGDPWKVWGARGALAVLEARRRWIGTIDESDPSASASA